MAKLFWGVNLHGKVTRGLRRFLIGASMFTCLLYFAIGVGNLFAWHPKGRLFGFASCIWSLQAMGYAMFWMWFIRRTTSTASLDERSQMDFGKSYEQLKARQKFDVQVRVRREAQAGRQPDERDALMQRDAERRAFVMLKRGLPVFVLLYWAVCLWMPVGSVRGGLLISAVVLSGMVIPVMILPDLIRLWTEPDEVGEAKIVPMGREA